MHILNALLLAAAIFQSPDLGPAKGSKIPSFELRDQNGQTRTLQSLMGPKGLMLVFFRSADW